MPATVLLMFWTTSPVAPWQDDKWLAQMRRTLRPNQYLRMIENGFVTTESPFIEMTWYDACVDHDARPLVADPMLPVYVGIDASHQTRQHGDCRGCVGQEGEKGAADLAQDISAVTRRAVEFRGHHRAHTARSQAALPNSKSRL